MVNELLHFNLPHLTAAAAAAAAAVAAASEPRNAT